MRGLGCHLVDVSLSFWRILNEVQGNPEHTAVRVSGECRGTRCFKQMTGSYAGLQVGRVGIPVTKHA